MSQSTRTYLDGTGATKTALTGSNGTSDSTGVTVFDVNGNPLGLALDGTDASGVSQATGGVGIRGWLSTIASYLAATLKVQLQAGSATIGAVTQAVAAIFNTSDAANGAIVPGSTGSKSMLAGLYYSGATPPAPSAGQQVAAQSDAAGRMMVNTPLSTIVITAITPTVSVATYAARQALGGLLTFSGALPTLKGTIEEVEMLVANGDTPVVTGTLYLFDTNPTGSTTTDHATVGIVPADYGKIIAAIPIATVADASGAVTPAYGSTQAASTNTGRKLVSAGSSTIWGVFVINSATAIAGASDVTFRLKTLSF